MRRTSTITTAYAAVNRFRLDDLHPHIYRTHDGGKTWQKIVSGLPDNEPVNTVREDPVRKGLLFAGTERAVYVSFNDGDHWQPLRLNMPRLRSAIWSFITTTSSSARTAARSGFSMTSRRCVKQMPKVAEGDAHLFAPQLTYRVRRNMNTDTPLPPEEPAGKNPPDGAMIDYFLKTAASGPVTIEIFDSSGKIVRHFSSSDKPDPSERKRIQHSNLLDSPAADSFVGRRYAALRVGPALSRRRMRWIMNFPISAIYHDTPRYPLGPAILPGVYTVKLAVGGKSYSQPLTIKMDPRVKTQADGLRRQFELESKIVAAMHLDAEALRHIRSSRSQLNRSKDRAGQAELLDAIGNLEKALAELEGDEGGYGARFLSTPAGRSLTRLNVGLNTLLAAVASSDTAPTTQAVATFNDLQNALDQQLERWREIETKDVPALNIRLKQSGSPELDPESAMAGDKWGTSTGGSGEEEP